MYMAMARAASMRGTCYRLNVGAVLVLRGNVVSLGYNGAPAGEPHCTGNGCRYFTPTGCKVVHAEINALDRCTHEDASGYDLYVTHSPCIACAARLIGVVSNVYFETAYRDPTPVQTLLVAGVMVYQLLPSGLLVDQRTGTLCQAD